MQDYPHHYRAAVSARSDGNVTVTSPGLESIESAGPAEFGGPGDLWSPETFLVAAVADCLILSFRAIARASRFDWLALSCDAVGDLDRIDKVTQFTAFHLQATLEIPAGMDEAKALRLLQKAEKSCLITNSLIADSHLEAEVRIVDRAR